MSGPWLHSARFDLTFFVGPAVVALALVAPALLGWMPAGDAPLWMWLALVVGVDVAHVWSTLARTYLDPAEIRRRPWLYVGTPVVTYLLGCLAYAISPSIFWTILAYVAVHHFVRQQVGFVALYRHLDAYAGPLDRHLDHAAVYVGTLVPIVWWHLHLPRQFAWFLPGDFVSVAPEAVALSDALWVLYGLVGIGWIAHRVPHWARRRFNWGRDLVMASTWSCWGVGIVVLDSDYAFTATNVLLHGVPYVALIWLVSARRGRETGAPRVARTLAGPLGAWLLLVGVLALAFAEEWLWDATVWREHPEVFGDWSAWIPDSDVVGLIAVPLLTLPQAVHYVLDGFIWRMDGSNPGLDRWLFGQSETDAA